MINIEYCPNEKKETKHEITDFARAGYNNIGKKCLSCGLFREISKKNNKVVHKEFLEINTSKKYRDMMVDKGLDTNILDKINSNKNIKVISTCTGHLKPIEPYSKVHKYPEIIFCSKNKLIVPKIKDTTLKIEKSKIHGICYRLMGIKNTPEWWNNVAEVVSKINSKNSNKISSNFNIIPEFLRL